MLVLRGDNLKVNLSELKSGKHFFSYLYFLVIVLLLGIVLKVGIAKISDQRRTLAEINERQALLLKKEKTLSQARNDLIGIFYGPAGIALPATNPVLVSLSEVKRLLSFYLLPLENYNINVGGGIQQEGTETVGATAIKLVILGPLDAVLSFLREVESIAPLSVVDSLNFSSEENLLTADVVIHSFWSPFGGKKSRSGSSFQEITEAEKEVLVKLGDLRRPELSDLAPTGPFQRKSPF